ncbi:hypothetical protein [Marinomonas ostreistagni]|uniref:Lipoprotein n=1 Tax=Marinomonas ostreistagni TaxID=359209 RepID=A0ABS0ZGK9_9GAMM|nr:hypothetical protein [Marinomonas ostreistagni]MBJ7552096.1 hypothetical protein [Marinomonas ostreistagni]
MRLNLPLLVTTILFALVGCASEKQADIEKHLNSKELTGLSNMNSDLNSMQFDYSLDSPAGKSLPFSSCYQINNASDTEIETSQQHLLKLMKVNCLASDFYFQAQNSYKSFLPSAFDIHFIKALPPQAQPDLGGQPLGHSFTTLGDAEPTMIERSSQEHSIEVELSGDLVVRYVELARGDFNHDGVEDALIRLDWYVSTAFGKGFDLIMISRESDEEPPRISWRAN